MRLPTAPTLAGVGTLALIVASILSAPGCGSPSAPLTIPSDEGSYTPSIATSTPIPSKSLRTPHRPPAKPVHTLIFSLSRFPHIADHVRDAQAAHKSRTCTIDRPGADENRDESLAGIPTRKGYDRDEYPPAMCKEGGLHADVRYVPSSENRSAGAWMGSALSDYPNGTVILFRVGP